MSIINEALKKARREQGAPGMGAQDEVIQPRVRVAATPVSHVISGVVVLGLFIGLLGVGSYYAWAYLTAEGVSASDPPAAPEAASVVEVVQTAPEEATLPEPPPPPPPPDPAPPAPADDQVRALLDSLEITSILVGGGMQRAVINGQARSLGDLLETDPPLKLIGVERNLLRFELPDGREVEKKN